ncbi:hypothetical protein [Polyangium jinanense]|uniref:Uncharacterized protein n=1 Tax=Polyangium jinanense TaxID=2829994 RepID=A0A9X4AQU3_9BACT|nr:hypothetical protein [Polyangium jinanense]MDC3954786.1 hypothetical protein [Polyangium jinanense]MDC3981443.1 hypothetical protein [Polyangium jinanense]
MVFHDVRDHLNDGLDWLRGYADKLLMEAGAARELLSDGPSTRFRAYASDTWGARSSPPWCS